VKRDNDSRKNNPLASGSYSPLLLILYIVLTMIGIFGGLPLVFASLHPMLSIPVVLLIVPIFPTIGAALESGTRRPLRTLAACYLSHLCGLLYTLLVTVVALLGALYMLIGVIGGIISVVLTIVQIVWILQFWLGLRFAPGVRLEDGKTIFFLFAGSLTVEAIWFGLYSWGASNVGSRAKDFLGRLREKGRVCFDAESEEL
jgi:hypothetical protein